MFSACHGVMCYIFCCLYLITQHELFGSGSVMVWGWSLRVTQISMTQPMAPDCCYWMKSSECWIPPVADPLEIQAVGQYASSENCHRPSRWSLMPRSGTERKYLWLSVCGFESSPQQVVVSSYTVYFTVLFWFDHLLWVKISINFSGQCMSNL